MCVDVPWDVVVLDEGHKVKNPYTKVTKAANMLRTQWKLLLTGTPIQVMKAHMHLEIDSHMHLE